MRRTVWHRRWLPVALLAAAMVSGCKDNGGSLDDASPLDGAPGDDTEDASVGDGDASPDVDNQDSSTDASPDIDAQGGLIGKRDASADAAEGGSSDASPNPDAEADAGAQGDAALGAGSPCGPIFASGDVLLELGHTRTVNFVRRAGARVVSSDPYRWILFDATTGAQITSSDIVSGRNRVDLAASTLMVERSDSTGQVQFVDLRAAGDGHVLMTVSAKTEATYWWRLGLASDGSYLWGVSPTKLTAWSTSGQMLADLSGNYTQARIIAAPGELRIASGPAGTNVIQTISTSTGGTTTGPTFAGSFHSWFSDGAHFLTTAGLTARVYSKASVQEDIVSLPNANDLTAGGNYFWINWQGALTVYAIGGGSTPVLTRPDASGRLEGSWIVVSYVNDVTPGLLDVIDISGSSLSEKTIPALGIPGLRGNSPQFHADTAGNCVMSIGSLVYASSAPDGSRLLSCGRPTSIVGAPSGHAAVAIETGEVLYFDLRNGERNLQVLSAASPGSSVESLSSDGSMLAVAGTLAGYPSPGELKVFSMADGAVLRTLEAPGWLNYATFAAGGTRLGAADPNSGECARSVTSLSGDMTYFCADPYQRFDLSTIILPAMALSPDGTLVAAPEGSPTNTVGTKIYRNGTFVGAAAGHSIGWIDDSRLLVQTFTHVGNDIYGYEATTICDVSGAVIASPTLPPIETFQTVSSDEIYVPTKNTIYSLTDGSAVWTSPNTDPRRSGDGGIMGTGAIVGPYVVFLSDHKLFIEAY